MTLKIEVKHFFAWPFSSPVVNMIQKYKIDLGVDSDILKVVDIK